MYRFGKALVAVAALAVWAPAARPAEKDRKLIAREGAIEVILLRQPSVQQDLKIGEEEVGKINEFATRQWRKVRGMAKLSEEEQNQKFLAMAHENEQFLKDTLKPEQVKRLNQICMQVAGLIWVTRSDIASELGLSAEQKEKLKKIHEEAHQEAMQISNMSDDGGIKEEKYREMRESNRRRLMSVLTDEQKSKWKEMAGEKFSGELHFGPREKK